MLMCLPAREEVGGGGGGRERKDREGGSWSDLR